MSSLSSSVTDRALGASTLLQPLLAAALGLLILFGVGFSHIEAFHNAAHDTRHSAGFPCH